MDPGFMAFLMGAGIGVIEDESIVCPECGCDFGGEEASYDGDDCFCPCCSAKLNEE